MAVNIGVNIQRKRGVTSGSGTVAGSYPDLLIDVDDAYFRANGGSKAFSEVVTHSRSGNATMVDSDGLLKWAPHNLLTYSEDFSQWTQSRTSVSSGITSPDGNATAYSFVDTADNNNHITYLLSGAVSAPWTLSVFVKQKDAGRYIQLRPFGIGAGVAFATFDPSDGSVYESGGTALESATSQSIGNGWFRVSITCSSALIDGGDGANLVITDGTTGETPTYLGDGSGVYIWGAHLYRSDLGGMVDNPDQPASLASYVPTTSSAVYLPRRGHHVYNGSAWVNEGLLHESEARVNVLTQSDLSDWASTSSASVTLPDGTTGGRAVNRTPPFNAYKAGILASASTTYTISVFAKAGTETVIRFGFEGNGFSSFGVHTFDLSALSVNSVSGFTAGISDEGNGWVRCYVTGTTTASAIALVGHLAATTDFEDFYVYGAQVEAAPTPSSYIPTAGAAVTRAAETLTIPSANLPYSSTAMSIQMDGRMTYADTDIAEEAIFARWQEDANNNIALRLRTNVGSGRIDFVQFEASVGDAVFTSGSVFSPGILVPFNIASRHGSTFINGAVDGVALTADTTPTALPDLSSTDLELGYDFMGVIKTFRIWDKDIGDAGLIEATAPSLEPSLSLVFDSSESSFVVQDWS